VVTKSGGSTGLFVVLAWGDGRVRALPCGRVARVHGSRSRGPGRAGAAADLSVREFDVDRHLGTYPALSRGLQPGMIHRLRGEPVTMDARASRLRAAVRSAPFHLGRGTAAKTFSKALPASGWHTTAGRMRLLVEGGLPLAGRHHRRRFEELPLPRPGAAGRPGCG